MPFSCNVCLSRGESLEDPENIPITDSVVVVNIEDVESKLLEQILSLHQVFYLLKETRKVHRGSEIENEAELFYQQVWVPKSEVILQLRFCQLSISTETLLLLLIFHRLGKWPLVADQSKVVLTDAIFQLLKIFIVYSLG
jgi:hypothetical protein